MLTALLSSIWNWVGFRGALALFTGLAAGWFSGYLTGKWVERQKVETEIRAVLAEYGLNQEDVIDDALRRAIEARRRSERESDTGGMPDDGFQRD